MAVQMIERDLIFVLEAFDYPFYQVDYSIDNQYPSSKKYKGRNKQGCYYFFITCWKIRA